MSGRYLLDTNIVIALFGQDEDIVARLAREPEVFLSAVVLGELYFGAANSGRPQKNAARVDEFAATCLLVPVDDRIARRFGQMRADLRRRGRPIPEHDLWIAASAVVHGLTVVTRDSHFQEVEGLSLEAW